MAEGYDTTRFHSTIDEGFVCCICLGVLQDPKQCENNEHYFCSGCIKKHLEKTSHSCPVCQDKLTVETLRKAPRIVADCVSRYKISCDHAARGCDAVLELGALQAHVQDCDFMPVSCSNEGCDDVVSKRDVKQHELDLCRFKTTIEVLDLNGNPPEWHEFFVNLPIKVSGHKCVVHGNRLLIIGGCTKTGENLDTIYELLLIPPYSSKLLCHMKKKRALHGVELFADKVLIAGGIGVETDVEIFDIARNECVEMPPLPSPVMGMGTVRRGDTLLLIGGAKIIGGDKCSNEIIEYDFKTGQSKVVLTMKTERAYCSCVSRGNALIVIGGAEGDHAAVDCFNFLSNSWKRLPSMAEARALASAVLVNMENLEF